MMNKKILNEIRSDLFDFMGYMYRAKNKFAMDQIMILEALLQPSTYSVDYVIQDNYCIVDGGKNLYNETRVNFVNDNILCLGYENEMIKEITTISQVDDAFYISCIVLVNDVWRLNPFTMRVDRPCILSPDSENLMAARFRCIFGDNEENSDLYHRQLATNFVNLSFSVMEKLCVH